MFGSGAVSYTRAASSSVISWSLSSSRETLLEGTNNLLKENTAATPFREVIFAGGPS